MLAIRILLDDPIPIEFTGITPDRLRGQRLDAIRRLHLLHGNRNVELGTIAEVVGDADDETLEIHGRTERVKSLGALMRSGSLTVFGSVGMHAGADMIGGRLTIHGSAGDWLGAEMVGGTIQVHGDAGHLVGAAYRGAKRGMRGGSIRVDGSCGDEVGAQMRRGYIAIGGNCGGFTGVGMIAGTILIGGSCGPRLGAAMKRGTIAVFGTPPTLPPTFRRACRIEPTFLRLFADELREMRTRIPLPAVGSTMLLHRGDLLTIGLGEVFTEPSRAAPSDSRG